MANENEIKYEAVINNITSKRRNDQLRLEYTWKIKTWKTLPLTLPNF